VVVVFTAWSWYVIVADRVVVLLPSAWIQNCGSNGDAAGIGLGLRHFGRPEMTWSCP
jgi:hypothetical protein